MLIFSAPQKFVQLILDKKSKWKPLLKLTKTCTDNSTNMTRHRIWGSYPCAWCLVGKKKASFECVCARAFPVNVVHLEQVSSSETNWHISNPIYIFYINLYNLRWYSFQLGNLNLRKKFWGGGDGMGMCYSLSSLLFRLFKVCRL